MIYNISQHRPTSRGLAACNELNMNFHLVHLVCLTLVSATAVWDSGCRSCASPEHQHEVVIVPDSYNGWITVEHDVVGAPPLPVYDGKVVFRVPDNGYLATSTPVFEGSVSTSFEFESGTGIEVVPGRSLGKVSAGHVYACCTVVGILIKPGEAPRKYSMFYVGDGYAGHPPEPF